MDIHFVGLAGIFVFLILLVMGIPIAYSMLLVGLVGLITVIGPIPAVSCVQSALYYSAANWLFVCIPMFILMGHFASKSDVIKDIFYFFSVWLGKLPGSLAVVTILSCAMFSFATGSSLAATAVMGKMTLPEMDRYHYDRRLSLGSIIGGASLGNFIPPSIGLVLFGVITQTSIGRLLIAAVLPGIMITIMFILVIIVMVIRNPNYAVKITGASWKERWISFKNVWGILVLIVLVLGSIFFGIATPTEASSIGAFGAFVILCLRHKFTWKALKEILINTTHTTTMIFLLLVTVSIFSKFMTLSGITKGLVNALATSGNISPSMVIFFISLIFFIAGCALDPSSLLLVITPMVFPLTVGIGYDPVLFGVMTVGMIQIGSMTPPVGLSVYVLKSVTDVPLFEIFRSVVPFLLVWIGALFLLHFFPKIALFLPSIMI